MDITFIHRLLPPLPSGAAGNAFLFIKQEQGTCTVQLVQTYLILNLNKNKQSRKKNPLLILYLTHSLVYPNSQFFFLPNPNPNQGFLFFSLSIICKSIIGKAVCPVGLTMQGYISHINFILFLFISSYSQLITGSEREYMFKSPNLFFCLIPWCFWVVNFEPFLIRWLRSKPFESKSFLAAVLTVFLVLSVLDLLGYYSFKGNFFSLANLLGFLVFTVSFQCGSGIR